MKKKENKDTRYYLDLDLKTGRIIRLEFEQKEGLSQQCPEPLSHRVFLTKGQYSKLAKALEISREKS